MAIYYRFIVTDGVITGKGNLGEMTEDEAEHWKTIYTTDYIVHADIGETIDVPATPRITPEGKLLGADLIQVIPNAAPLSEQEMLHQRITDLELMMADLMKV